MASSTSKVYNCAEYAESCGAVLFDASKEKVCLLLRHAHADSSDSSNKPQQKTPEWVLPKGRRNCGEHRYAAALREVEEETGHACHLQPLTMATRAPTAADPDGGGEPRLHRTFTESFMVTHRVKGDGGGYLKLIYWFLAVADERMTGGEEERFTPRFFEPGEALRTVTCPDERMVLEGGIALMGGDR
ncbi:hypothetical protein PG985_003602 [Apiospora marii]|uniref:Nudix hydrolase domain-containing protein n=1 Tax=Apiospora marii TaxID=335849 RepID=A0ABR1SHM3_9PEZI